MIKLLVAYTVVVLALSGSAVTPVLAQAAPENTRTAVSPDIERYNQLISRYRYDKPDSALFFTYKGMQLAKAWHDKNGEAMMLNQLGMINDNQGRYIESKQNYTLALAMYRSLHQGKGEAAEIIRLGVVELRQGNYDKAIDYFLQALKVSEGINDPKGIMEANITLGEAYMGQHKYPLALQYLKIAEKINDTIPFSNLSLNLYNDFGVAYTAINDLTNAKAYLNIGIAKSNIPQYQGLNITLTNNLAAVYAKEGNTRACISLQKSALHKAQAIHNFLRELQTLTGLATTYKPLNADTSLSYLFKAKALAQSKDAHKQVIEALQSIAELYTQKGNFPEALKAKNEQYALADKYFYKEMSKQIASLQSDYELSKSKVKVQELSLLNSRQLFERRIITAIALGAIVIMLITAWFYYRTQGLNRLLRKTNRKLDKSNQVKDKLLSILGHDLRTPFISVMNLLSFIDDEDLPAESRQELIAQLSRTTQASLETLDSLLKWGEMQIKGIQLNQTEFAVKPVTDRILSMLESAAGYKSIELINQLGPEVKVFADMNHVEFVLRNLISNAIKFTGTAGHVTVSARLNPVTRMVSLIIEDNGVGVAPERIKDIFSATNISSNGTYNEKGTSLGLMMCKEFMKANQGRIYAESELGKGSRFITEFKSTPSAGTRKRKFRFKLFRPAHI